MRNRPRLIRQAHGGALYAGGVPGHRGGYGRQPSAMQGRYRQLTDRALAQLERSSIPDDPSHPLFFPLARWAADYGYGRTVTRVASGEALPPGRLTPAEIRVHLLHLL